MPPITTPNTSQRPEQVHRVAQLARPSGAPASRAPAVDGRQTQIARMVSRNSTVMITPGSRPAMYRRAAEVLVIEP